MYERTKNLLKLTHELMIIAGQAVLILAMVGFFGFWTIGFILSIFLHRG